MRVLFDQSDILCRPIYGTDANGTQNWALALIIATKANFLLVIFKNEKINRIR